MYKQSEPWLGEHKSGILPETSRQTRPGRSNEGELQLACTPAQSFGYGKEEIQGGPLPHARYSFITEGIQDITL